MLLLVGQRATDIGGQRSAQVVDCCCNFDALFDGRCCLKFVAANVDEPLVELMPLLGFCPFRIHNAL